MLADIIIMVIIKTVIGFLSSKGSYGSLNPNFNEVPEISKSFTNGHPDSHSQMILRYSCSPNYKKSNK